MPCSAASSPAFVLAGMSDNRHVRPADAKLILDALNIGEDGALILGLILVTSACGNHLGEGVKDNHPAVIAFVLLVFNKLHLETSMRRYRFRQNWQKPRKICDTLISYPYFFQPNPTPPLPYAFESGTPYVPPPAKPDEPLIPDRGFDGPA